jgi:hypothetical protein
VTWALVLGVDPGPTPGIVALHLRDGRIYDVDVAQVNADLAAKVVQMIVEPRLPYGPVLIGVERFVVSRRSGRSSSAGAGRTTRDMVGVIEQLGSDLGALVVQRPAVTVKAWAVDDRLKAAGIEVPRGMTHARDAARHGLFAACHAEHLPDPLSRTYKKPRLS